LAIGRISKPFGVRGELVVELMTDDPERFTALHEVLVGATPESGRAMVLERVHVSARGVRIAIEGIGDRTAAEALRGHYLFVAPADRIRLPPGRHFVHSMLGLAVVTEEGDPLGTLEEVLKLPAHDVYVIRGARGELLLPAVEEFVRRIDLEAGTMTVRLIEGMSAE
jgi:16S rRNA processing protein RimM